MCCIVQLKCITFGVKFVAEQFQWTINQILHYNIKCFFRSGRGVGAFEDNMVTRTRRQRPVWVRSVSLV